VRLQNIVIDPSTRRLFFGGGVEHRDETRTTLMRRDWML
jgi:hypothetical protein